MNLDNINTAKKPIFFKNEYTLEKIVYKKFPSIIIICILICTLLMGIIKYVYRFYSNKIVIYIWTLLLSIIILLYVEVFKYLWNFLLNKHIIKKARKNKILDEIDLECKNIDQARINSAKCLKYLNLKEYSVIFENTIRIFKYKDIKRLFVFTVIRSAITKYKYSIIELKNGTHYRIMGENYYNSTKELTEKRDFNIIYKKDSSYLINYILYAIGKIFLMMLVTVVILIIYRLNIY